MSSDPVLPASGRRLIYRSALMAVAMQWSVRAIGLVSVVALARLLQPSDFGVLAVALTAAALVELFGWIGLRQALVRIKEPEPAHYDTAFTIQLIIFSTMAVIMVAIVAPAAARFYDLPVLRPVLSVMAIRFLCTALINTGIIDFERNFQFERDLKMRVGARLAALTITLVAAVILRNYWALVIGMIAQSAFHTVASYIAHPYRPRLSLAKRHELLAVSMWIFVSTLAEWLQSQIERLVLGRFATTYTIGLYSTSKDLALIFTQEISEALNRVTFVTVSGANESAQENPSRLAIMMGAYAMIAAPLAAGLAATAQDTIAVLLGAKWLEATQFLEIVAIYTGIQATYHVVESVLQASGRAKRAAFLSVGGAIVLASAVIGAALLYETPVAIAYSALGASLVMVSACVLVLSDIAAVNPARVLAHVLRPALAAFAMFLTVKYIADPDSGSSLVDLLASVTLGAPVYAGTLFLIWLLSGRPEGSESELWIVIRKLIPSVRKAPPLG